MSSLAQLRQGMNSVWGSLAEGWQQLRERTTHALTRFNPRHKRGELETAEEQLMLHGARWGLLTTEVSETADAVLVRLEVPGMEADDFDISVVDDHLVVRGEKHAQREQTKGHYHLMECAYGLFERAIPLPVAVEEDKARAKYKRGILSVEIPKRQSHKRRRIEIKAS